MFDQDRAQFERALSSVVAPVVPSARIRRAAENRAASIRARRNRIVTGACVVVLCALLPFRGAPAVAAAVAYVQQFLRPAQPAQMIVLARSGGRAPANAYRRVDTVDDAQKMLPFRILVPPVSAHWKLTTVMVDAKSDPAVALLYEAPRGTWVRVTERPATARPVAEDADVSALLTSAGAPRRTVSGISLSRSPAVDAVHESRTVGKLRTVISATGGDAKQAVSMLRSRLGR